MTNASRQILFLTFDVIGPRMGGSAIRVLGLARALTEMGYSAVIVAPCVESGGPEQPFPIQAFDLACPRATLSPLLEKTAVAVLPLHALARLPLLKSARVPLVFDLYDPVVFELMESAPEELPGQVQLLNHVLRRGDFFLCASARQRDLWLGALVANGRITTSGNSGWHDLIDIVPFGIDPIEIPHAAVGRPNLTAAIPALTEAKKIVIWPGGIWDWTDPGIVMQAMRILEQRSLGVHLVLFAGKHPGEGHVVTAAARKARALADEFQLNRRSVHFIDEYIAYEQRGKYLAECDAAVSTHRTNLESRFAYRTRLLDCLWAGLPIICTEGDVLAEMVERHRLGIVVPAGNAEALAQAFARIATDEEFVAACHAHLLASRSLFAWPDAIKPLARFCDKPRITHIATPVTDALMLAQSAWRVLKTHGTGKTLQRLKQYLRSR